jgi:hypothetical protein
MEVSANCDSLAGPHPASIVPDVLVTESKDRLIDVADSLIIGRLSLDPSNLS